MPPPLLISAPDSIGSENWLHLNLKGSEEGKKAPDTVVLSGLAHYDEGTLIGHQDNDGWVVNYHLEILVGPLWREIKDCTPMLVGAGYIFLDSDTADHSGFHVTSWDWSAVDVQGGKKIQLEGNLSIRGGPGFSLRQVAFHATVKGSVIPGQDFGEIP
ncbi:MAG: hypothetical protein ABFS45_27490 [Pseudomonadota bacterium]